MALRGFDKFFRSAIFFYGTMGIRPYKQSFEKPISIHEHIKFLAHNINIYATYLFQILYVCLQPSISFLESTLAFSYFGFVSITCFRLAHTIIYKRKYANIMNELQAIYPRNENDDFGYQIDYYETKCTRITFIFSTLYMVAIWTFNLYMIMPYLIIDRFLGSRNVEMELPYLVYIPWEWKDHWSYYPLYVSQVMAGYTSGAGQIGNDLLLVGAATQLVMHYDYIAKRLREYIPTANPSQNMQFLSNLVAYHIKILELSEEINELFGVPLFFNFMISSGVICFLGFLMTVGADLATITKLSLFLAISIAEIFVICYYGQELIEASTSIARAAYDHNWYNSKLPYKQTLLQMVTRAQKPANLKATGYLIISRNTMTFILQISYKFFAILRTMYTK